MKKYLEKSRNLSVMFLQNTIDFTLSHIVSFYENKFK